MSPSKNERFGYETEVEQDYRHYGKLFLISFLKGFWMKSLVIRYWQRANCLVYLSVHDIFQFNF